MKRYFKPIIRLILPLLILSIAWGVVAQAGGSPRVRVMHASPDAPPADIYLDGQRVFANLGYEAVSSYQAVTAGTRRLKVLAAGTDSNAPGVVEADLPFAEGQDYTLVAMGNLQQLEIRQFSDNNTPPEGANKARLRFIHASPDLPAVDVCVTGTNNCLVSNLSFKNATGYALPDVGTYTLGVRRTGSNEMVYTSVVNLTNGEVYTIFLIGTNDPAKPYKFVMSTDARWEPTQPPTNGAFLSPTALTIVIVVLAILMVGGWFTWQRLRASAVS